jgi:hypothetical protein
MESSERAGENVPSALLRLFASLHGTLTRTPPFGEAARASRLEYFDLLQVQE